MQNALTVTNATATALTVNDVPVIERVYVTPSRNGHEIIDRIREASASVSDIGLFLKVLGPKLNATDLKVVDYALARARYRENLDLSLHHVAVLADMSIDKVRKYYKRLQVQVRDRVSNRDVSRLLSAIADY